MWIKFILNSQPYRIGDVTDWTPDESARRLIAEGQAEETTAPEGEESMKRPRRTRAEEKEEGPAGAPSPQTLVNQKDMTAPANTAAVAPVRK